MEAQHEPKDNHRRLVLLGSAALESELSRLVAEPVVPSGPPLNRETPLLPRAPEGRDSKHEDRWVR